jgi:hypothetical protein
MDKQLRLYYENQFELFTSQGWKDFIHDMTKHREALSDIRHIKTPEELYKAQGELRLVDQLLNHEAMVELAYKANETNDV